MPDDARPDNELEQVKTQTSDGEQVPDGIDPDITQDADPHQGS